MGLQAPWRSAASLLVRAGLEVAGRSCGEQAGETDLVAVASRDDEFAQVFAVGEELKTAHGHVLCELVRALQQLQQPRDARMLSCYVLPL